MAGNSPTGSGALGMFVPDKDVHSLCTVCMLVLLYVYECTCTYVPYNVYVSIVICV